MVFALAGDSTMTSVLEPGVAARDASSSAMASAAPALPRFAVALVTAFFFTAAFFVTARFLAAGFPMRVAPRTVFVAMLVYRLVLVPIALIDEARPFH